MPKSVRYRCPILTKIPTLQNFQHNHISRKFVRRFSTCYISEDGNGKGTAKLVSTFLQNLAAPVKEMRARCLRHKFTELFAWVQLTLYCCFSGRQPFRTTATCTRSSTTFSIANPKQTATSAEHACRSATVAAGTRQTSQQRLSVYNY